MYLQENEKVIIVLELHKGIGSFLISPGSRVNQNTRHTLHFETNVTPKQTVSFITIVQRFSYGGECKLHFAFFFLRLGL